MTATDKRRPWLFERGRMQYVVSLTSFPFISLSLAGVIPPSAVGHACWTGLLVLLALQVVLTAWRWRKAFWPSYLPALATAGVLVVSPFAAHSINHNLLLHRFHSHQVEYDTVADRLVQQTYPDWLLPDHKHLAQSVILLAAKSPAFVIMPDAPAGSVGFVRIDDPALVQELSASPAADAWRNRIEPIQGNWYLFAR